MLTGHQQTFFACASPYETANIVLTGAPYDSTTSFRPGARFAPSAMRSDSFGLETYSPYQDKDLVDMRIFDSGDLELPFGAAERPLKLIEEHTEAILADDKLPVMIGGEHLVSLGAIRAIYNKYPDVQVLHFDAHTDLRNDYLGENLSHSTVMRRVWDMLGDGRIYQFGVRSGERAEFMWAREHTFLHKFSFARLEESIERLKGKPVYFSLDLDVLDPGCFPGTGTPEAGGMDFTSLLEAIFKVCTLDIVGCDIVELCPGLDNSGASTALACKVLRELLLALNK